MLTHKEYVVFVERLLAEKRNGTAKRFEADRDELAVMALNAIRRLQHGPTWAKTALRLWEDQ